jgi:hypothetical protein
VTAAAAVASELLSCDLDCLARSEHQRALRATLECAWPDEAIRSLAPHFEHKLFLSATPHNGYSESFSALLELLDDQRFARAVTPNRAQLDAVMVRRMKSELELRWDGSRRFAKRLVKHLEVPYTEAEREIHRTLQAYADSRHRTAATAGHQQSGQAD